MRKKNSTIIEESSQQAHNAAFQKAQDFEKMRRAMYNANIDTSCQIKIKWKRSALSHSDDTLHQIFKKYGTINEILLSSTKGTSATLTYTTESSAKSAVEAFQNSEEFKVTLNSDKKKPAMFTFDYKSSQNEPESKLMKEVLRVVEIDELKRTLESLNNNPDMPFQDTPETSTSTSGEEQYTEKDFVTDFESLLRKESSVMERIRLLNC